MKKLKNGELYKCLTCQSLWYLNEEKTMMYVVYKEKDLVIDSFDNQEIVWIYCDWVEGIEKLLLK